MSILELNTYKHFQNRLQASPTAVKAFQLSRDWFKLEEVPVNASYSMQNADKSDATEARGWRSGITVFYLIFVTFPVAKLTRYLELMRVIFLFEIFVTFPVAILKYNYFNLTKI